MFREYRQIQPDASNLDHQRALVQENYQKST